MTAEGWRISILTYIFFTLLFICGVYDDIKTWKLPTRKMTPAELGGTLLLIGLDLLVIASAVLITAIIPCLPVFVFTAMLATISTYFSLSLLAEHWKEVDGEKKGEAVNG